MAAVRIDRMDRDRLLGAEFFQQRDQLPVLDGSRYGEAGQAHDAESLLCQPHLCLALGDGDAPADLDFAHLPVDAERPAVEIGAVARNDAIVPGQLLGPLGRATLRQIGR